MGLFFNQAAFLKVKTSCNPHTLTQTEKYAETGHRSGSAVY